MEAAEKSRQLLDAILSFQEIIMIDFPNVETLVAEVNRFSSSMENSEPIVRFVLSTALALRYRSISVIEEVCHQVNITPIILTPSIHFTKNDLLQSIIDDEPETLSSFIDRINLQSEKVKVKLFGCDTELDYLSFAAATGSLKVYNLLLGSEMKPTLITLVCAIISGQNQLIEDIFTLLNPNVNGLLRIALMAYQSEVFLWLLEKFTLPPEDSLTFLLYFISKTSPLPENAFFPVGNLEKCDFNFNYVFESGCIHAMFSCIQKGYVSGPNLSEGVIPFNSEVQNLIFNYLNTNVIGNPNITKIIHGNMYRLSNLNPGPYYEFYCDDMRILKYSQKPHDEPQMGNNFDLVPKEALALYKEAADAGHKAGKQLYEFYRWFGPDEFIPPEDSQFSFEAEYENKVFGNNRSAIYVTNGWKFLDEKFYNPPRFIKDIEQRCLIPDDGTALWRDYNFAYGTLIYCGMIPNKTKEEGADRMIKFALYGYSYHRTYTLCLYAEHHPEFFPPSKVDLDYVKKLRDYYEFLYKKLDYNPNYYTGDEAWK